VQGENSFVKPVELDASDHDVKADDHVIMRRNRPVDLSISIKALYNCTAARSSVPILGTNVSIWGDSTVDHMNLTNPRPGYNECFCL
jgi:hypothetical protein